MMNPLVLIPIQVKPNKVSTCINFIYQGLYFSMFLIFFKLVHEPDYVLSINSTRRNELGTHHS